MVRCGCVWAAAAAGGCVAVSTASASPGSILQPVSVTTTAVENSPIGTTIDQSGLSASYVSGVTDFDTYVPATNHGTDPADYWDSDQTFPKIVTFDLGQDFDINGFAYWRAFGGGETIGVFELFTDADDDYDNGAELIQSFIGDDVNGGQPFTFDAVNTRYVHLRILSNQGSFSFFSVGEFAFRESAPIPPSGDVLVSQPPDVNGAGITSDMDPAPSSGNVNEAADSFSLGQEALVGRVRFWGGYLPSDTAGVDDFTLRIYADDGGAPAESALAMSALTDVVRTEAAMQGGLTTLYEYDASLSAALLLDGGVTYWVAIVNDTADVPGASWSWRFALPVDGALASRDPASGPAWSIFGADLAFELFGAETGGASPCPADLDGSGDVGSGDLSALLGSWGACP